MIKIYTSSLRSKILLGYLVILIIMFLATLWSVYNFYRLNESIKFTMQENYTSIIAADNMGSSLDEQLQSIVIMYNQNFEIGEKLFEKKKIDYYYWFQRARESVTSSEGKNILDTLDNEYGKFLKDISDNIDYNIYISNKRQTLRSDFVRFLKEIENIKKRNNAILEINHSALNQSVSNVKSITQTATIFILIILFSAIGLSLAFGSQFSDYIVKPITKLRQSVIHIAEGHFEERIEVDENADEISGLAEEFNKMSEKLQVYEQLNLNKILYEKKKSELIIESMDEPVLMIDENFNVLSSNNAFNEVFTSEVQKQIDFQKLLTSKNPSRDAATKVSKDLYQKEDIISIHDKSGTQKYFKIIASSLVIPDSGMRGAVIVFNDITKYQELDRMKSEFIARVSHELKTPLTSMGMALGMMDEGVAGKLSVKQADLVDSMKDDYSRLNKLVYEILELTKLESNTAKLHFEKFEVGKLCYQIIKKFSIQAKEKSIDLKFENKSNAKQINGHYDYLMSAFENIISNALRFTPEKGFVKISLSEEKKNVIIEISDSGIGISPDNLIKIFDKFTQLDDTSPGSVGLGLSIAKEIIDIHDGEIRVLSEPGKGSTFQIKLPAI
jgi:two-component system, NtrC family, sensor histidine kinase KinB